ncbi:hypothetical protein X907_0254 [Glycocaulis alkaliphilus]|uniref:Uncharacterized protein n=1 Tax=Glycocaulis alkaliphilus TaxID=1434191 RepID=A0A3T0E669_9PROT|nr:hypothetical protein X907_0254 [Glycocaulis alkaliphilus]
MFALIPCAQQTSGVGLACSCSRAIEMICSSLNLLFLMGPSPC